MVPLVPMTSVVPPTGLVQPSMVAVTLRYIRNVMAPCPSVQFLVLTSGVAWLTSNAAKLATESIYQICGQPGSRGEDF